MPGTGSWELGTSHILGLEKPESRSREQRVDVDVDVDVERHWLFVQLAKMDRGETGEDL